MDKVMMPPMLMAIAKLELVMMYILKQNSLIKGNPTVRKAMTCDVISLKYSLANTYTGHYIVRANHGRKKISLNNR